MIRKLLGLAAAVVLPSLLAAQTATIPNDHASDRGKAMVALHSQGAQHRATHRRGDVVHPEDVDHDRDDRTRPEDTNPKAALPATRATPAHGAGPAKPATPAVPANGRKPSNPGQSGNHRP
jgi:hypothetical protein